MSLHTVAHRNVSTTRLYRYYRGENFYQYITNDKISPIPNPLTDGADDSSVAGNGGLWVDVQQTQVLQEGVGHGSVELLRLDEGRAHILRFSVGHRGRDG